MSVRGVTTRQGPKNKPTATDSEKSHRKSLTSPRPAHSSVQKPDILQQIFEQQTLILSKLEDLSTRLDKLETISTGNRLDSSCVPDVGPHDSAVAATESCNVDSPDISLTKEVSRILMQEKLVKGAKDECRKIKASIHLEWNERLKFRNKYFRNYVKNHGKEKLYNEWLETSPDYIPYKYRPKKITGEREEHTAIRIEEARFKYNTDYKLLKLYAATHKTNYDQLDQDMLEQLRSLSSNEQEYQLLSQQWKKETSQGEERALQLWSKNETFLRTRKHEDVQNDEVCVSEVTWKEKLSSRHKAKGKKPKHDTVVPSQREDLTNDSRIPNPSDLYCYYMNGHPCYPHPITMTNQEQPDDQYFSDSQSDNSSEYE